MKKYILIFASMLLIFSLLAGCSKAPATGTIATEAPTAEQTIAATEASVPEQTTVPNETLAAEDIVHEDDATSYYIEVAYADQIARYYTALSEKWDEVKYLENEMSITRAILWRMRALDLWTWTMTATVNWSSVPS